VTRAEAHRGRDRGTVKPTDCRRAGGDKTLEKKEKPKADRADKDAKPMAGKRAAEDDEGEGGEELEAPKPADAQPGQPGCTTATSASATSRSGRSAASPQSLLPSRTPSLRRRGASLSRRWIVGDVRERRAAPPKLEPKVDPYTGTFKQVMDALKTDKAKAARSPAAGTRSSPVTCWRSSRWARRSRPSGDLALAARCYGSIIDLFPRAPTCAASPAFGSSARRRRRSWPSTPSEQAVAEQRADHPASHRLLAFSLLRRANPRRRSRPSRWAWRRRYPSGRFAAVDRILREDAGLIAAAWMPRPSRTRRRNRGAPQEAAAASPRTSRRCASSSTGRPTPTTSTSTSRDAKGGHAFYSQKTLPSGGELYEDVTTGYGPECFTIRLPKGKRAAPYQLQATTIPSGRWAPAWASWRSSSTTARVGFASSTARTWR
jgi:hypothetical protein